jgi:hypothetical protein
MFTCPVIALYGCKSWFLTISAEGGLKVVRTECGAQYLDVIEKYRNAEEISIMWNFRIGILHQIYLGD